MLARILGSRYRLAWNNSGANLASGVASTLLSATDADLGLLEVDEFALPEVMRRAAPAGVSLGNLFRDQLDRYGELEHIAERWRAAVATLLPRDARRQRRRSARRRPRGRTRGRAALRRRRSAARAARAAARGRLEVLRPLRRAVRLRRGLRRPPRRLPLPELRARAAAARRRRALDRPAGARRLVVRSRHARGTARVELPLPGLYNVYNALAAAVAGARARRRCDEIAPGSDGSRPRSADSSGSRPATGRILMLLIKNPAGANEAIRTLEEGGAPRVAVIALNDASPTAATSRGSGTSTSSRCSSGLERDRERRARGRARAPVHLRRLRPERLEVVPVLEAALDRGLELRPAGGELGVLPTYTAMLELRRSSPPAGSSRPYWEGRRMRIRVAHLYPGLPQHLRRPRQHRRARPARRARGARARGDGDRAGDAIPAVGVRPRLRRRRPGPRAGAHRPRSRGEGGGLRGRSKPARRCSPSAAATSCSGAATGPRRLECRAPASSRSTRSPASAA